MMDPGTRLLIVAAIISTAYLAGWSLRRYFAKGDLPNTFDLRDVGADPSKPLIVEFTSPYCYECKVVLPVLKAASVIYSSNFALVDARERPDLTAKYGIRATPTILVVGSNGTVKAGWLGTPPEDDLREALASAAA